MSLLKSCTIFLPFLSALLLSGCAQNKASIFQSQESMQLKQESIVFSSNYAVCTQKFDTDYSQHLTPMLKKTTDYFTEANPKLADEDRHTLIELNEQVRERITQPECDTIISTSSKELDQSLAQFGEKVEEEKTQSDNSNLILEGIDFLFWITFLWVNEII